MPSTASSAHEKRAQRERMARLRATRKTQQGPARPPDPELESLVERAKAGLSDLQAGRCWPEEATICDEPQSTSPEPNRSPPSPLDLPPPSPPLSPPLSPRPPPRESRLVAIESLVDLWSEHAGGAYDRIRRSSIHSEAYGEIAIETLLELFDVAKLAENDTFVDLGAGCGNALALATNVYGACAYGVEVVSLRVDIGRTFLEAAKSSAVLEQGDLAKSASDALLLHLCRARLVLLNSVKFQPDLIEHVTNLLRHAPRSTLVATFSDLTPSPRDGHRLPADQSLAQHLVKVGSIEAAAVSWTSKRVPLFLFEWRY